MLHNVMCCTSALYTFSVTVHYTHSVYQRTIHIQCYSALYTFSVTAHYTHSVLHSVAAVSHWLEVERRARLRAERAARRSMMGEETEAQRFAREEKEKVVGTTPTNTLGQRPNFLFLVGACEKKASTQETRVI